MLNTIVFVVTMQSALMTWFFFCIALPNLMTRKLKWAWLGLLLVAEGVELILLAAWPKLPPVFEGFLLFFIVNSPMLARITRVKWVTATPFLVIFDSFRRFLGGMLGLIIQHIFTPALTIYTRSFMSKNFSLVMELNQLLAVALGFLVLIPFGLWCKRANERYHFVERLRKLSSDGFDYTLVAIYIGVYFSALWVIMEGKIQVQTDVTMLLGIVLGAFYYYLVLSRFEQLQSMRMLENLRGYDAAVSKMNEEMHSFSHDYQNVLLSLSYFVKRSDDQELQEYFKHVTDDNQSRIQNMGTGDIERLRYVTSGYVKGLIYAKLLEAQKQKIHLQILINEEIRLREERSVDLVRIFGNVLDNAIEAAAASNHTVKLSAKPSDQNNIFQIENQIPETEKIDLSHISQEGITTKNGHLGIGMANIRRLAKQGIEVEQVIDKRCFVTKIKIPRLIETEHKDVDPQV